MNQLKQTLSLGLVVLTLGLLTVAPLGASDPKPAKGNWDDLKKLAPGDEIRVVLNDAKSYRGKFATANDEAIVVRTAKGEQTFTRANVLRVSTRAQGHRLRNAALGGAIGAGAGLLLGVRCARDSEAGYAALCYAAGSLLIGGIGAGVGAVMPTGGWQDIYRAR